MRQLKITKSITNRESVSLDKYLQEIGREELISVEEESEIAQRIHKVYSVTSSGDSVLLPATDVMNGPSPYREGSYGGYWSTLLRPNDSSCAADLNINPDEVKWGCSRRCNGKSVRPVSP